ncbi:MAG: hypothetical protein IT436_18625 [Phycisphaerales bacterium]|nr:hypothetical protein [Phycisphaerales bacterium]
MKRLELIVAVLVVLVVLAAVGAFLMIPRTGPAVADQSRAGVSVAPEMDPARRLWAADPARAVYVFGEAGRPGAHELPEGSAWKLKDLLAAIGGFTPVAEGRARVMRKVDGAITEILKLSKEEVESSDLTLQAGDVIYLD